MTTRIYNEKEMTEKILQMKEQKMIGREIAEELSKQGFMSASGHPVSEFTVSDLFNKHKKKTGTYVAPQIKSAPKKHDFNVIAELLTHPQITKNQAMAMLKAYMEN